MLSMRKITLGVRVEPNRLDRLDRLAVEMTRRAVGAEVSRGDAARVAMDRGIAALEKELGLESPPPGDVVGQAKKGSPARKSK